MLIGYLRRAATGPTTAEQEAALRAAGVTKVWKDEKSEPRAPLPMLAECVKDTRPGDVVAVADLAVLGRHPAECLQAVAGIIRRGGTIRVLQPEPVDFGAEAGAFAAHLDAAGRLWRGARTGAARGAPRQGQRNAPPRVLDPDKEPALFGMMGTVWFNLARSSEEATAELVRAIGKGSEATLYRAYGPRRQQDHETNAMFEYRKKHGRKAAEAKYGSPQH